MNKKELIEIIKVYSFEVNWLKNKNKQLEKDEVALKAFVEEFVEAWEDGMGGDSSLYDAAKRLL